MTSTVTFDTLSLPEKMSQALARMNYTTPTSIQAQAIPFAMQGRDVLGSAQTGTGKTAAFSIPMIAKLMEDENAMALVLAPTRELAAQTLDVVHKLTSNNRDMRTALLIGGEPMGKQFDQLRQNPRMIIGTPGRINDHLRRNPKLLARVNFIALDEADRMLDMGFSEQIDEVFAMCNPERQMLMFSATFPESIIRFSKKYLNNPERVSVNPEQVSAPKIKHEMKRTTDNDKYTDLVAELVARDGSVIIFAKTQHGTERLSKRLESDGHDNVVIHGGLRQNQRDRAVRSFRSMKARIMVATDVAARGLDIPHIEHVINYDLPQVAEDYIHRIGRTARAGAEGNAMCFVTPSETGKWNAINRIMNPGAAPEKGERGGDRGNYRSGGRSYGPKKSFGGKSFGGGSGFGRGGDRDRGGEGRSFGGGRGGENRYSGNKEGQSRSFEGRGNGGSYNKRPAANDGFVRRDRDAGQSWNRDSKPAGRFGDKPQFDKKKPTDRNWNNKEDRGTYTRPKEYKPDWREEGRGDGRMDNRMERAPRSEGRSEGRSENRSEGRNYADRPAKRSFDRPNDRSANRSGGERSFDRSERPAQDRSRSKTYFRADDQGGFKKPKADKAGPAKKPFKFKEHNRKGERSEQGGYADRPRRSV